MGYALQVFISSTCYDLRDLRASIKRYLEGLGITPLLSDEAGFPRENHISPYVSCLMTLEDCPLIIGIIDKRYGMSFKDWAPYDYADISPTHAELRHTLRKQKKLLLYVHQDILSAYQIWRRHNNTFPEKSHPSVPDLKTLEMLEELKGNNPAPWIESFNDVTDIIRSLQSNLINEIYHSLRDQEKRNANQAAYIFEKILELSPDIRRQIEAQISPALNATLVSLEQKYTDLQAQLDASTKRSEEATQQILAEREQVLRELKEKKEEVSRSKLALAAAATRDLSWLTFIRTTLMPKQPGRVPFHNDAEVALRGYHCSNMRGAPILTRVTWSKLAYNENNLHRGYHAGLIFYGKNFAPGVTFAVREIGNTDPTTWSLPNIYFDDYLELSAGQDEEEWPLYYKNQEFCVKNPGGECSEWVRFDYPYDIERSLTLIEEKAALGMQLADAGRHREADEYLRKASVMARFILGKDNARTIELESALETQRKKWDQAERMLLKFIIGQKLRITKGEHQGKIVFVVNLLPTVVKQYYVSDEAQQRFLVADDEVESLE